ncbi:hypothetical protein JQ599_24765 [Bradyrhizobium diazoefficiens]|nr:hypothetical protein [Bradyrhizobium diazoefficiens]MBR0703137.1 hypothetical protein [Bradyrhizobium diazoefficiens]MBR0771893.1 hypothetical protein [Bradyrhizobium diazoefficiens]
MTRLPAWRDQDAVADWAWAELEEAWSEAERQHAMRRWDQVPGVPVSEVCRQIEQQAAARATRGDFGPLADLLRPDHPMNASSVGTRLRDRLSPATWSLIADRLTGTFKAKAGRPPMTSEERRASSPVHDAAEDVAAIEAILKRAYPKQSSGQVRGCALLSVGRRYGIEVETLAKYVGRPAGDRRRL